jgi:hypothetical protein
MVTSEGRSMSWTFFNQFVGFHRKSRQLPIDYVWHTPDLVVSRCVRELQWLNGGTLRQADLLPTTTTSNSRRKNIGLSKLSPGSTTFQCFDSLTNNIPIQKTKIDLSCFFFKTFYCFVYILVYLKFVTDERKRGEKKTWNRYNLCLFVLIRW